MDQCHHPLAVSQETQGFSCRGQLWGAVAMAGQVSRVSICLLCKRAGCYWNVKERICCC